jgi:hypothetical protein
LSLTEWAILELTNEPKLHVSRRARRLSQPQLLTTKEAYVWAAMIAYAAETDALSAEQVENLIRSGKAVDPNDFLQVLHQGSQSAESRAELTPASLSETVSRAYHALVDRGLIEDPPIALVGGIAILVLGWLPVSFTKKTTEGKLVSRKINALFWKYERSTKRGVTTTIVQFRLMRLLHALKAGFAAAQGELTGESSQED